MKREIQTYLQHWLTSSDRKPLVLRGARQVGKTHSVREIARQENYDLVELNLDLDKDLHALFGLKPAEFFNELSAIKGVSFKNRKILLFIDEIQACPQAIAALRYFKETTPEIPVIAAGSLLDFALRDFAQSMPVGRIEFCYMYPLTFSEFVRATESDELADAWLGLDPSRSISQALHTKFLQALRTYYFVGGMPEVVAKYIPNRSILDVQKTQSAILQTFESDFLKYSEKNQQDLLSRVFRHLPASIGKKLKYSNLSQEHRASQVRKVIELLQLAGLCQLIFRSAGNGIPLGAEADQNHYKALFLDIGLVHHALGLRIYDSTSFVSLDGLVTIMEGAMAEQFVGQEFVASHAHYEKKQLFYWHRESKNSNAEIDYLDTWGEKVIPCEVKAGSGSTLRSLQVFLAEKNCDYAVRLWANNIRCDDIRVAQSVRENQSVDKKKARLYSLPLYFAGRLFGRDSVRLD